MAPPGLDTQGVAASTRLHGLLSVFPMPEPCSCDCGGALKSLCYSWGASPSHEERIGADCVSVRTWLLLSCGPMNLSGFCAQYSDHGALRTRQAALGAAFMQWSVAESNSHRLRLLLLGILDLSCPVSSGRCSTPVVPEPREPCDRTVAADGSKVSPAASAAALSGTTLRVDGLEYPPLALD